MNRNPYKTNLLGVNSSRTSRTPAILLLVLCFFVALAATASAQQQKFNTPIHHSNNQHLGGANEKLPRSVPSPAVSAASERSSASRMELERLEHANIGPRAGSVHHTASRSTTRGTALSRTRAHSAPIDFAYQGPHNGMVGHRNSASRPR